MMQQWVLCQRCQRCKVPVRAMLFARSRQLLRAAAHRAARVFRARASLLAFDMYMHRQVALHLVQLWHLHRCGGLPRLAILLGEATVGRRGAERARVTTTPCVLTAVVID